MHDTMAQLEELWGTATNALKDYNQKIRKSGGEMTPGDVEYCDKLAHILKSVKKTMAMLEDDDYSYMGSSYTRGGYDRNYARGYSRNGHSYARRDSMGRYSRDGDNVMDQLRDVMDRATDERTRQDIQRIMDNMGRV